MTVLRRWPQVLWLTVVWVLLWGTISVKIVLGGILVAAAVTALFPLPLLPRLPFRPWPLLRLGVWLLADLVVSGAQVAWETVRHGPRARAGIVAVPLRTGSERVTTLVAAAAALTPGSFVLQIDRPGGRLYVYALGLRSAADATRVRRQMERLQDRVVRAAGEAR
ncbi:Na+/H+ antiporter subunit E [Pseudonocardia yuanmonensis]|uniref:Na+/H+ antiporter subunit E n=1 Tax=Pseudonocardia yuanmonensis TaxID=1095914 RepID=A0ABP8WRC2_9PSEU